MTVGVFVQPGELPATVKNTLVRRNRCLEYDAMGDANARFLIDELLPFVAREFGLNLSNSGNDRCIAGSSSGGIAAFNAAWERPEAFSRVYANSGSFVAFRGGHEFPTLVRKYEAKPIRAYLTTGTRDMENCAGDWFLLDQEMDKALRFSSYDYVFRIINGGHGAGYYDNYREAMSYLWKDWPSPIKAGAGAPRVRDIILPGEPWQLAAQDRREPGGPAVNARGEVFFAETADNAIYRIGLDGQISPFLRDAGHANGLSVGPDGELYTVSRTTAKIMRYDSAGKATVVAEGIRGHDVLATPGGGLYVTSNGDHPDQSGAVWFVKDGKKTRVDSGLKLATGLAYRPDRWLLSVADGRSKSAYSYQIAPDGSLVHKERYFWLHVPDQEDDAGACTAIYAREGPLLIATRLGVQVLPRRRPDPGDSACARPRPRDGRVSRRARAGHAVCLQRAAKIWKRKVKVHGVGSFTPWTSVNQSSL